MLSSVRWGYFRIITGTIVGGVLGFYVMHRLEVSYKEKWNERLKKYEEELTRRKRRLIMSLVSPSSTCLYPSPNTS
ncbi:hypothetical protein C3L33_04192, partial [Rhododendron williamsianum]